MAIAPIIQLALTAASAVATYSAGKQQAKATSKASWDNYYIQKNQLEQESIQQNNQAMMEKSERAKQLMLEQAKIKTLAGESGVAGSSVDALLQDSYMQAGIDLSMVESNRQNRNIQGYGQERAQYASATSKSNQAYANAPSLVGTALQIGKGVYDYSKS